jgi:hypothetical protein
MAQTVGCQLCSTPHPPEELLDLISVTGSVNRRAMVRLEGLGKLKKENYISSGLEPAAFRLVAQRLNHERNCWLP